MAQIIFRYFWEKTLGGLIAVQNSHGLKAVALILLTFWTRFEVFEIQVSHKMLSELSQIQVQLFRLIGNG